MNGMASVAPENHGSGRWKNTSTVAMAMTSPPSSAVMRSGSEVAETTTGTVISSEKGLVSPPVM